MAAHAIVAQGLSDLRHVASCASASGAAYGVMRVFTHCPTQPGGIASGVTAETQPVPILNQIRSVLVAVYLVTIEASQTAMVHDALDEIVSLHAVFVRARILPEIEILCAEPRIFEVPNICQTLAWQIAHGPIDILSCDGQVSGPALTVTLQANIVSSHGIELFRIHDVGDCRMRDVFTSRTMTFFASNVPFGHLPGLQVVIHRMTAVTRRACRALLVFLRIERHPPIRPVGYVVWQPLAVLDIPLRRQWVVVLVVLGKVALLPAAAVD